MGSEKIFDGAFRSLTGKRKENPQDNIVGIKIVFISPDNALILYSFSFTMRCSNNTAEYEAFISGFELALKIPMTNLTIYHSSELIVKQIRTNYNV